MNNPIFLLREQIAICKRILAQFDAMIELLQKTGDTGKVALELERSIGELNKNAVRISGSKFSEEYQPLLQESQNLQMQIRRKMETARRLIKLGKAFVEFNLNVLTRTTAKNTYGAAAETGTTGGRRIFDANV